MNEIELLDDSIVVYDEKLVARDAQHVLAKVLETKTNKTRKSSDFLKLKDYFYYKGKYGKDVFDLKGIKYPDKISKIFKNLAQMITLLDEIGCSDILDPYILELKNKYHIDITFNKNEIKNEDFIDTIRNMVSYQFIICENSDKIKIDLAKEAETINFVKKPDFVEIVKLESDFRNKSEKKQKRLLKKSKKLDERIGLESIAIQKYLKV